MYEKKWLGLFVGRKERTSRHLVLLNVRRVPDVMFFLPARRVPSMQCLELYVRFPTCRHFLTCKGIRTIYEQIKFWTVKFSHDIWIVEIWTVETRLGLRLQLGLGLVMTVQFMTIHILTVQLRHVTREQQPPTFWPMSIVVKRLDASRCHLVWTMEVRVGPDHIVLDGNPAPP